MSPEDIRKYEEGWTREMSVYWRERIMALGIYDTGRLYNSFKGTISGQTIEHRFVEYGIYVAAGVGNFGKLESISDQSKKRKRRDWFTKKYYSSVMRLSEFEANFYGVAYNGLIATALENIFEHKGIERNL